MMIEESKRTEICDVTGREYYACAVRKCPHPAVIKRYGHKGEANVSIYVCRKCEFSETFEHVGGVGCKYAKYGRTYKTERQRSGCGRDVSAGNKDKTQQNTVPYTQRLGQQLEL